MNTEVSDFEMEDKDNENMAIFYDLGKEIHAVITKDTKELFRSNEIKQIETLLNTVLTTGL